MPAGSFKDYAKVMNALPGTGEQIAERCGMSLDGARGILRKFWTIRLVHPEGLVKHPKNGAKTAVWVAGPGDMAHGLIVKKDRPGINHVAFGMMWTMLQSGATKNEIVEQTGIAYLGVGSFINDLHADGKVYISTWQKDALNRWSQAVWTLGEGKDAKKPRISNKDKCKLYRERSMIRRLNLRAGGIHASAAQCV